MISFSCSRCGMKIKVQPEFAGRSSKCPTCKTPLIVPAPSQTQAEVLGGQIDGTDSSLAKANVDGGVTLEQVAPARSGQRSVQDLLAGRNKTGGRYIIAGEIARGGMGAVLRAVDCDLRREVAVKLLLDQADPKKKLRFVEEAQITGQLEHPNILPIHELGVDAQKRLFFSMKMVKGRTLAQILDDLRQNQQQAQQDYSLGRLLNILVNVCNGLAYAHSRGVVNRDLKPANVMIGEFGEVYVMDWGLAKVLKGEQASEAVSSQHSSATQAKVVTSREQEADLTQEGSVLGTPVYMPPEQANGQVHAIDQRSDVYSLGAILYEMLSLQAPVAKDGGYLAILMRVLQGKIIAPEQRNPARAGKIPRELSAIAMKALARNPQDRYPNVESLRRDIERFQEGRSVSAQVDTFRQAAWKLVKRNKLASAFTAALAVVLVWSSVVSFQARRQTERVQAEKDKHIQDSLPTFVRAARLSANEKRFDDVLKQLDVVLAHESNQAEALLLKGQVFIIQQNFAAARENLAGYATLRPGDNDATEMLGLCRTAKAGDIPSLLGFARIFHRQQNYSLVDGLLSRYGKNSQEARQYLLGMYREIIEKSWQGKGGGLQLDPEGLHLSLVEFAELADLSPLRGMPLTTLNLTDCARVRDLTPLKDIPLTWLNLGRCQQVSDLSPLKGIPLTRLNLNDCGVRDLRPLEGMPLIWLRITACPHVRDLTFLQGLHLEEILLTPRNITKGMDVLRQMKSLKTIGISDTGNGRFPAIEFWKKYDAGDFNK